MRLEEPEPLFPSRPSGPLEKWLVGCFDGELTKDMVFPRLVVNVVEIGMLPFGIPHPDCSLTLEQCSSSGELGVCPLPVTGEDELEKLVVDSLVG